MRPLLLTDLDDTLFQTARKMPINSDRIPAAQGLNGETICFMYQWQQEFINWALGCMTVIPVTARGIESFQRVHLPFEHGAVCVHGAAILTPSGTLDANWHLHIKKELESYQARLVNMLATILQIGETIELSLRGWLEYTQDTVAYLVIKSNAAKEEELAKLLNTLRQTISLEGFYTHMNGNNLAILPKAVNKRAAAMEILRQHTAKYGRVPVFGMGDSISDLGFMRLCDFAAFPPNSQLGGQLP